MVVLSAIIMAFPWYLLKLPDVVVMSGVGVVLIVADMIVRVLNRSKERWLFSAQTGGYLFFIPVWIFGIAVIIINLINAFVVTK